MQETLYIYSPYTLVLSIVAIFLSATFSTILGQKIQAKQMPKPFRRLTNIIIFWNLFCFLGTLLCSDNQLPMVSQIIFGLQALAWVQAGHEVYKLALYYVQKKYGIFQKIYNIVGVIFVIALTFILCFYTDEISNSLINTPTLFKEHFSYVIFIAVFLIFVFPELIRTIYELFRNFLQTSDIIQGQICAYMTGSLAFFTVIPLLLDIIIPLAYHFEISGKPVSFLIWYQYSCIFLTIICGQYFTSVSFKNKSAFWLLNKLTKDIGDCLISFDARGNIIAANPATETLFNETESKLKNKNIQDLIRGINFSTESLYHNMKIPILNEEHTFNVGVYHIKTSMTTHTNMILLSDQSNSLFYKKRIESLNSQFAEYKQDLLRYQDRLDSSQKKFNENNSFLKTLINALPFQFWAKNEYGIYMAQNQTDMDKRGNLIHTSNDTISKFEQEARDNGNPGSYTSYELLDGKEISEDEANIQINSGKSIFIYENMFIPIISKHKPYKVIGIKIDITEQERLERERNILKEQKNISSRLEELGTLCGAFAHDYNNILGSQIGFCELTKEILESINCNEKSLQDKINTAINFVAEATKAAKRGKVSLEELLNTIRGEAKAKSDEIVFAPYMIIEDVKKKLSLTIPQNISIVSEFMDKNLKITAIPAALDRIITNLSNNAIFAMKEFGGTLSFKLEFSHLDNQLVTPYSTPIPPGDYVKISIADTGIGMDSLTLERIFSPFFTTKAPGDGLGLGLSSALRLIKEGKGYLTVQTRLGKGTNFNLYWSLYNENKEENNVHNSNY